MGLLSPHPQPEQLWLIVEHNTRREPWPEQRFTDRAQADQYAADQNAVVRVPGYYVVVHAYGDE